MEGTAPTAAPAAPVATPGDAAPVNTTPGVAPKKNVDPNPPPGKKEWVSFERKVKTSDGKERTYKFDSEHDFDMFVEKNAGAERKFEEAARLRKDAEEKMAAQREAEETFKKNPARAVRDLAKRLGLPEAQVRASLEEDAKAEAERAALDPESRRVLEQIEESDRELARLRKAEADRTKAEEAAKEKVERDAAVKHFNKVITESLGEFKEYDPAFAADRIAPLIAAEMRDAARAGYALTPQQAAAEVKRGIHEFVKGAVGKMSNDALRQFLGPKLAELNREDLERRRAGKAPVAARPASPDKPAEPKSDKTDAWLNMLIPNRAR